MTRRLAGLLGLRLLGRSVLLRLWVWLRVWVRLWLRVLLWVWLWVWLWLRLWLWVWLRVWLLPRIARLGPQCLQQTAPGKVMQATYSERQQPGNRQREATTRQQTARGENQATYTDTARGENQATDNTRQHTARDDTRQQGNTQREMTPGNRATPGHRQHRAR